MPVQPGKVGVHTEMKKFKEGTLHSGSKTGPLVKNRKQAIAIALKEAGMSKNQPNSPNPSSSPTPPMKAAKPPKPKGLWKGF